MISVKHHNNTISLIKEGNIKLDIQGTDTSIYKVLFYELEDCFGNQSSRCIYDSGTLHTGWYCVETEDYNSDKYPNKIFITIVGEMGWFADFFYDKHKNEFYRINHMRNREALNDLQGPLIITGAPGGGTSYITRLLKYRGLFFGKDTGSVHFRKPHESITFRSVREILCFNNGQYTSWFTEEEIKLKKQLIHERLNFYVQLYRKQLECKFRSFWGDAPIDTMWAWKDPMVSIDLPIWHNIFPKARLMMINRNQEKLSNNMVDLEGNWFRNASEYVLRHFLKPDLSNFSQDDVFYCNFHDLVKDIDSMNEMLSWIGLDTLNNKEEFINLLKETGYEGRVNNETEN